MKRIQSSCSEAFTLIELLVVMLIIAIVATILIGSGTYANKMKEQAQSTAYRAGIISALDEYKSLYGEYPIVGSSRHYSQNYTTDTTSNCPWTNVNLTGTNTTYESMTVASQGRGGTVRVDYALVYPLMSAQEEKGRVPFFKFDKKQVLTVAYNFKSAKDVLGPRLANGLSNVKGNPVYRAIAEDPATKCQYKYECSDGRTYTLGLYSNEFSVGK